MLNGDDLPLIWTGVIAVGSVAAAARPSVEADHGVLVVSDYPARLECRESSECRERRGARELDDRLRQDEFPDELRVSGGELQHDNCATALGNHGRRAGGQVLHERREVIGVFSHSSGERPAGRPEASAVVRDEGMPGRKGIKDRSEREAMGASAVDEHDARPIATHVIGKPGTLNIDHAHDVEPYRAPHRRMGATEPSGDPEMRTFSCFDPLATW